jgi:spore coat polysaccharide biosynthesis protein SpsF
MSIGGKPAIRHVVDRARLCGNADKVAVAVTENEKDAPLIEYCAQNLIPCFSGNEHDVLDRYYQAAVHFGAKEGDYIVRVTGDCPFIDPSICDQVIELAMLPGVDYASNTIEETYPDGLDCEAFSFHTLWRMDREAAYQFEREHVTQYAKRNPDKFNLKNLRAAENYNAERWTLDEPDDYGFLRAVYDGIGKTFFGMEDVLRFLERNPDIRRLNQGIARNEGLLKSMEAEGI